jgi:hypothetical protein
MRNFVQIAANIDVVPILNALAINADLWNEDTLRTAFPGSPHAACDDIHVFFNDLPADPLAIIDEIQTHPRRAWAVIPQLRPLVLDLMRRVEATQLGRVIVTRLAPGSRIAAHVDEGAPATFFTRYQIALQSYPGALFRIEDETVNFATGDAWLVNNCAEHEVINNSAHDRIALIVDVRVPTL